MKDFQKWMCIVRRGKNVCISNNSSEVCTGGTTVPLNVASKSDSNPRNYTKCAMTEFRFNFGSRCVFIDIGNVNRHCVKKKGGEKFLNEALCFGEFITSLAKLQIDVWMLCATGLRRAFTAQHTSRDQLIAVSHIGNELLYACQRQRFFGGRGGRGGGLYYAKMLLAS
jgi:hypothetical protein